MSQEQKDIDAFHIPVGRAVDELRRSRGVVLSSYAFLPIESLSEIQHASLLALPGTSLRAVITGARARSLGMDTASTAMSLDATGLSFAQLRFLADPLSAPAPLNNLQGKDGSHQDQMALALAKYASLLPALLVIENPGVEKLLPWQKVTVQDVEHYMATPIIGIEETARAKLPMDITEDATLVSFRQRHGTSVQLALIIGDPLSVKEPLVRIHSSCITGDILGSLRCDCGGQLQLALSEIAKAGCGILIYLHQEGRGIGITNKLRAYALQERGIDTYDANLMLGFEEDERDFALAAAMLKKLGIKKIRLLTNNPHKIEALQTFGIDITERLKLVAATSAHSHGYLEAKIKKSGHLF